MRVLGRLRRALRSAALALLTGLAMPMAAAAHTPAPRIVGAPVSVAGAPRSLVSLVVPIPTQLEDADRLSFAVEISGHVDVLGRLQGELTRLPGERARPVLLTIRVPSDALVGLLDVADVVFSSEDGRQVVVPIILRVPAVLAIRISGQRELLNVAAGDRVELLYRVQNLGNAPETFRVDLKAPADWRVSVPRTVAVAPYGSVEVPVSLRVAPSAAGNDQIVDVRLWRREDSVATASVSTVLRAAPQVVRPSGLRLDPFVAIATTASGTGVASGLRLEGPVSDKVRVFAQASPLPSYGAQDAVLAQSGAIQMPFIATVSSDAWTVQAGATQLSVSELGGVNLGGRGVTASYDDGARHARVIATRPGFDGRDGGAFVGAAAGRRLAIGTVTGFASVLQQESAVFATRELTAVGADYVSPQIGSLVVSGGAAVRAHRDGTGLGLRAQVVHERERQLLRLRVLHAPGGTDAFALQSDELMLEARRQLTPRVALSGEYFRTADNGGSFADVASSGVSVGPRVAVGERSGVGLRVSHQTTDVTPRGSVIGRFGTSSTGLAADGVTWLGAWGLRGELSALQMLRTAELLSGATDETSALQATANLTADRDVASLGQIGLGASLQTAESGVGLPQRATSVFARWSGLPVFVFGQLVLAQSELRVFSSDIAGNQVATRLAAQTQFRSGLMLEGAVSRSPFVRDINGRMGWVASLRVGVTTEVLSGDRLRTPGVVFYDRDGDGERDPGEDGVAGVSLRYGNTRVTSGRDGRFRLPANLRGRLQVDASSLPRGFVVLPRVALDTTERRNIPLVATGSREVVLQLEADPELRVPQVTLAKADVWLRDADGFEWVGEHVSDGRFRFTEVPAGRYTLKLGFTRLEEPVRAEEPMVDIRAGSDVPVVIPVRGRNVRIISPPRGSRNGAGTGSGTGPRGVAPRGAGRQATPPPDAGAQQ